MIPAIIGGVVSAIASLGKSWLENRKVKAEGAIDISKAKIQAKVTKIEKEADMDLASVSDMKHSWKDELWTIFFVAVLTGCFLPWTQPYIRDGFIFLKLHTPDWFQWGFLGAIVASFGLRTWTGWKK